MIKNTLLIIIVCLCSLVINAQTKSIVVDFGGITSSSPINNITNPINGEISNLINLENEATGLGIQVTKRFNKYNTNGTVTPDAAIALTPSTTRDSFFGNTVSFGGRIDSNSEITLTSLDSNKSYTLSFFASRMNVNDNRETRYDISGDINKTLYLNPESNTSTLVSTTMKPNTDGVIYITISPGPNNNNNYGFFYLGALKIEYEESASNNTVIEDVFVDFGNIKTLSPWNSVSNASNGQINNLKNDLDQNSGISLSVTNPFSNSNNNGTQNPDPTLNFPITATQDSFYGNTTVFNNTIQQEGSIELSNLDPNKEYELSFFASRMGVTDNRETQYTLSGGSSDKILILNVSQNSNSIVSAKLNPKADGTITITASPGPNNNNIYGFFYLGAMKISYETTVNSNAPCTIVILGSSTASGTGASSNNSWVELYENEIITINDRFNIENLAKGGTNTYNILPTGSVTPNNQSIDVQRNITKALSYNPVAIIINMPSNDTANNYSAQVQMDNYAILANAAANANVPIWIATSQPRNFTSATKIQTQIDVKNQVLSTYQDYAIDFWSAIADTNGYIKSELDSGDGVHLNNAGHLLLFNSVLEKNIQFMVCSNTNKVAIDKTNTLEEDIIAYPNPFKDQLTIYFNAPTLGNLKLQLFDVLGNKIIEQEHRIVTSGRNRIQLTSEILNKVKSQFIYAIISLETKRGIINKKVKLLRIN